MSAVADPRRSLRARPLTLKRAAQLVTLWHRHHRPPVGGLFAIGAEYGGELVGAAIVGRPVARRLDDGETAEVTRLVVREGIPGAASFLLARVRRACGPMGYRRVLTYTLPSESGASLRAAGWLCTGPAGGGRWSRAARPRDDDHPTQTKLRWEAPA